MSAVERSCIPYWDESVEQWISEDLDVALKVLEFMLLVYVPSRGPIGGPDHVRELMQTRPV